MILLIDGDLICYKFGLAFEHELVFGDTVTIAAHSGDACRAIDRYIKALKVKLKGKQVIICFSDRNNWRFKLYPLYKSNRASFRRPILLPTIKAYLVNSYNCHQKDNLEADDTLGILHTSGTFSEPTILVSEDKDFKSIPGLFYNPGKGHQQLVEISKEEADYNHLYQALIGDVADNYPGCPGIGPAKAKKILDSQGNVWDNIVKAFESKDLTEADALIQARVARILRAEDYDFEKETPILWTPQ